MPRWIGVDGAERYGSTAFSLNDLLAPPAALLQPGDLQHLELGTDEVEQFVDILTKQTKLAAAPPAGPQCRSGVGRAPRSSMDFTRMPPANTGLSC